MINLRRLKRYMVFLKPYTDNSGQVFPGKGLKPVRMAEVVLQAYINGEWVDVPEVEDVVSKAKAEEFIKGFGA